jgi:MFS family permease
VNFYFFWLPSYLVEVRGIENFAPYAALPFLLGAFANAFGGWTSDALVRRIGLKWGRRTVGLVGQGSSVLFVLLSFASWNPVYAVISLAMGFAAADFMLPNCWAVCLDIGKRHSGTVTGFMNTAAQIGGAIALTVIGYFAGRKQWNIAILTMAVGLLISALLYLVIDASKPLVQEEGSPE